MTAVGEAGVVAGPRPGRLRVEAARFNARHPEWWTVGIAAGAWVAVATSGGSAPGSRAVHHGLHGTTHHGAAAASTAGALTSGGRAWLLMVLAMMLPTLVPRVRRVAASCVGLVRQRAIAETVAGALLVWCGLGLVVVIAAAALPTLDARGAPLAFLGVWLVAAAWQLTSLKWRTLRSCHAVPVPAGVGHHRARVRAGAVHGAWCAASCVPAMVAMALTGHSPALMAVSSLGVSVELVAHRPHRASRRLAGAIVAVAAVSVGVSAGG